MRRQIMSLNVERVDDYGWQDGSFYRVDVVQIFGWVEDEDGQRLGIAGDVDPRLWAEDQFLAIWSVMDKARRAGS